MPEPKSVTGSIRTLAQPTSSSVSSLADEQRSRYGPAGDPICAPGSESKYGPRERIIGQGADALTDVELLAVCLGTGTKEVPVQRLAQALLTKLGGMVGLYTASPQQLMALPGMGPAKVAALLGARALGERMARGQLGACDTLSNASAVVRYVQLALAGYEQEVFACLFLDTRHRLLHFEKLFFGSVDRANVYPREILKRSLACNAAAIILAHNHPSGNCEPSASDIRITTTLKELLAHLDVRVLDHVVVAAGSGVSMAQRGLI